MAAVSSKVIEFPQREKKESSPRRVRRQDGLFQVELRYKDQNGVSRRKSFYGKTQAEASAKKKAFERELSVGLKADDKTGFSAYADHWIATYKADLRPGTRATYQHDVDLMKAAFGGKKLKEITLSDVQAWINTRSGLSASAIKKSAMTARAPDLHRQQKIHGLPLSRLLRRPGHEGRKQSCFCRLPRGADRQGLSPLPECNP